MNEQAKRLDKIMNRLVRDSLALDGSPRLDQVEQELDNLLDVIDHLKGDLAQLLGIRKEHVNEVQSNLNRKDTIPCPPPFA